MSIKKEYEYLWTKHLWDVLKTKVVGSIHCKVDPELDQLRVEIVTFDNLTWRWVQDGEPFHRRICKGIKAEDVAAEIVSTYKKFILNRYFA